MPDKVKNWQFKGEKGCFLSPGNPVNRHFIASLTGH
jgi:hypothetical protein